MAKLKFYAVRQGREGPKIYDTWSQCERAVKGWPYARHKSFANKEAAHAWLNALDTPVNIGEPRSTSHVPPPLAEVLPDVSLRVEPSPQNVRPLPSGPDEAKPSSRSKHILSDEQQHILCLAKRGRNVFFTGSAGTGKSILLMEVIQHFGGCASEKLAITASTGIAAINIGGTTLHSWAGIGLGLEDVDKLLGKVSGNKSTLARWRETRTLIIDESEFSLKHIPWRRNLIPSLNTVSMVDGVLFDKLEYMARELRSNELPFGGIQLMVSGDFYQLPPVLSRHNEAICFAFEARSWRKCFDTTDVGTVHQLTRVYRQRDETFVNMLNALRHGRPDANTSAKFKELSRSIHYNDGLEPSELFPLREQVYVANETRLQQLDGELRTFEALDVPGYDISNHRLTMDKAKQLLNRSIAPEVIKLKVGAQVMLIKNLVQGKLVNGSIGRVVAFQSLLEAGGLRTEIAEVDKTRGLEGQKQINQRDTPMDAPEEAPYGDCMWPIVRFLNGKTLLLTPVEFEVLNVYGKVEARRDQIPLILSWALSIHKSQGQTLERVKIDLDRVFEKGQAYVALSRATCLEGLQVLNFDPSRVMAHPRVLKYYERLDERARDMGQALPSATPTSQSYDGFDDFDDEFAIASYYAGLEDKRETILSDASAPASISSEEFD